MSTRTAGRSTHILGTGTVNDVYVQLEVHECGQCGVVFGIAKGFMNMRRNDHTVWYCPNGHNWHFSGESKLEQATREAAEAKRTAKATRELLDFEQRSHASTKGHLTRHRKRAAGGVCPCCNRTFRELARHMKSKHPDYVKEHK